MYLCGVAVDYCAYDLEVQHAVSIVQFNGNVLCVLVLEPRTNTKEDQDCLRSLLNTIFAYSVCSHVTSTR